MTDGLDSAYPAGYDVPESDRSGELIPPHYPGMTKREAFAMAAMQGLLASPGNYSDMKRCGEYAVAYADILIAALNKPQETKA